MSKFTDLADLLEQAAKALREADAGFQSRDVEFIHPAIAAIINQLTYREREVIKLRYGLGQDCTYTLEECGRIFQVTRERVRQIEAKALRKLGVAQVRGDAG